MAAITNADLQAEKTSIQIVDLKATTPTKPRQDPNRLSLSQYHVEFANLVGQSPTHTLLLSTADSSKNPFFHDGCAYLPQQDELYLTSGLLESSSSSQLPVILISRVRLQRAGEAGDGQTADIKTVEWAKLRPPLGMPMPAGAVAYEQGIMYCSQGGPVPASGGLYYMPLNKPPIRVVNQYGRRPFNSVRKVAVAQDGGVWFTDPPHGFDLEIRPAPQLPSHVYWYHPRKDVLRVVADGLSRPSGIALSPDEQTLYVTDTDAVRSSRDTDPTRAATIYAYDVITRGEAPFLTNKRVFAFALEGVPAAVQTDAAGNVYAACGDGVEIWNSDGTPIGLIELPGGCSNLCFGRERELFICAEQRLWRLRFGIPTGSIDAPMAENS